MSYRLGFIGAGGIARLHAQVASGIGVGIAGFCDSNEGKAKSAAALHAGAKALRSADDLLALPDLDAVVVASPNHLHREFALAALDAGKDVLLEKPMGLNTAECDEIVAAAGASKQHLAVNFVCRNAPTTAVVRRFIEAGRFGRIYYARAQWCRRRGIPGLGGWFTTKAQSGGGVLIDLGVHMVDLILDLTGRPKAHRVSGVCTSNFGTPIEAYVHTEMWAGPPVPGGVFDVEDAASALIRFDGGLTMELSASWAMNIAEDTMPNGIYLSGEKGGCFFDVWGDKLVIATEEEGHLVDVRPHLPPGEKWMQGWTRQHEGFRDVVLNRTEPGATAVHGREVQAILDAIYRSNDEGCEVAMS